MQASDLVGSREPRVCRGLGEASEAYDRRDGDPL